VYAFDPDKKGDIVWQTRVGRGGANGGVQWGMTYDGRNVYAAVSDGAGKRITDANGNGHTHPRSRGRRRPDGPEGFRRQQSLVRFPSGLRNPAGMQSRAIRGAHRYTRSGVFRHTRRIPPGLFAEDGKVLWEYDTVRDFATVNGVQGRGGAIDGPGALVVKGMVFVNSGYSRFGGLPGNVLLALEPGE